MSKQPLTNETLAVTIIARTMQSANEELEKYNFEPDETDSIPPTIDKRIITSFASFISNPPDMDVPCIIVGSPPPDLVYAVRSFCRNIMTTSDALQMVNNEVAIRRDQIINGTVPQK